MARCPFAEWRPVPLRASQRVSIVPQGLVLHTAVSNSTVITPTGETRWHFYCNREGKLYQFFDTQVPAACQLDGNYWRVDGQGRGHISVETWDGAGTSVWPNYRTAPDSGPPWNSAQMAMLARLAHWLHRTHSLPLARIETVRGRGIGYHRQFRAPRDSPTLKWTSSHACPGSKRIAQVGDLINRARSLLGTPTPDPTPPPAPGGDMQLTDPMDVPQWLIDMYPNDAGIGDGSMSVQTAIASGYAHSRAARTEIADLRAAIMALGAKVDALASQTPAPTPEEPTDSPTYTVQPGDTLSSIAAQMGTTVDALVQLNQLSDPNQISPGQVLRLR
jgi:hypothetical protein